jgi:mRNA-degrading endonuclease toxin of MazEF toxin-antitoxin module
MSDTEYIQKRMNLYTWLQLAHTRTSEGASYHSVLVIRPDDLNRYVDIELVREHPITNISLKVAHPLFRHHIEIMPDAEMGQYTQQIVNELFTRMDEMVKKSLKTETVKGYNFHPMRIFS